ncbi:MAG: hypothetical protein DMF14_03435 [Verrucomicrobia bacterium]|nr:MAG: hypothetical protein DMF14_03435 [Verrucomicrobiota bacterium]
MQAKRLDGVSPYQFVLRKFPGRATLCGAAREPDSADKMPTGPTAKMAVLRPGFIPKNCRAAIFAAVFFLLAAKMAVPTILLPERDAGGCRNTPVAHRRDQGTQVNRPVWRTDLRSVFLKKRSR